jgi:hypothetical protein
MFTDLTAYLHEFKSSQTGLAGIPIPLVAEHLGVTHAAVTRQLREGPLREIKIGKSRLVSVESLLARERHRESQRAEVETFLEKAATEGRTSVFYEEIMTPLGMSTRVPADRTRIGEILGEISEDTEAASGILLSVLVHRKSSGVSKPGPGFFNLAEWLGYEWDDDAEFIQDETVKVLKHYQS